MYGTMTSAFSASRNARTSEVLGEGSNPMQSLDMGSKRQSAAGEFDWTSCCWPAGACLVSHSIYSYYLFEILILCSRSELCIAGGQGSRQLPSSMIVSKTGCLHHQLA
jgi:hypothetical protein